jgi:ribose transport system permease protein
MSGNTPTDAPSPGRTAVVLGRRLGRTYATEIQLLAALAALYLFFALKYPSTFGTSNNLTNLTHQGGILLVVAVGEMFALVVGGFDISVGSNMGFTSTVAALVMIHHGVAAGIAAGLAAAAAAGLVNGIFIAVLRVSPFVTTLAMLTFLFGLANQLSNGISVGNLPHGYLWVGANNWGPLPSTFCIAVVACVLGWLLFNRTRLGLYIYAIGGSRDTTRLAGVPVVRYEIIAYTLCGFLAGVGGIMVGSWTSVGQATLGSGTELQAIAAAVIGGVAIGGGVGRLVGVVFGVAILQVLQTGMNIAGLTEFVRDMITAGVLVAAVLITNLRSAGARNLIRRLGRTRVVSEEQPTDERRGIGPVESTP